MTIALIYLIHVPIAVRRVVMSTIHATNVNKLSIVMHHVKRNTDTNIKKSVRNMSDLLLSVQLSCMMSYYSKNHPHYMKIARYASKECQHFTLGGDTNYAVERRYAVGVFAL